MNFGDPATNNASTKQKKVVISRKELIFWTAVSVAILAIFNYFIFSSYWAPILTVTAGESQTFSIFDGRFTFLIVNTLNSQDKIVWIYGFNGPASLDVAASDFIEEKTGDKVSSKLDSSPKTHVDNIGPNPQDFKIGVDPLSYGLYHGALLISSGSDNASVEIMADVRPQMTLLVMIIIDGIALSIAAWSFIKFFNERYKIILKKKTMQGYYIAGEPESGAIPLSVTTFLEAKKVTRGVVLKNIILDIGTIAFGIGLGLITLVDNPLISGIHNLGLLEIMILIGLGLGIGSLKEIVYKS